MIEHPTVVVIGGGISGLGVAYHLKKRGIKVLLLEKEQSPGGTMKTIRENGWLIETGPNTALETTPLFRSIFEDLHLHNDVVYGNELSNKRYILRDAVLHTLPMSPPAFLKTNLFSTRAKLRLLKEPFIGRAGKEESIAEFVERRLGKEFLDYAINPFVAGVYAGNPEHLSVRTAFPKLYALEVKYGGLIKGMIKGARERKKRAEQAKDRAKLFSFTSGMEKLPQAIASYLGDSIETNCTVEHVIPMRAGKNPIYHISYRQGESKTTIEARAVIFAAPATATASIIRPIDPEMAATLESIYYPPVSEIFLGFKREQIQHPLDGFGFLIPAKEKRAILGSLWSSTLFPNRAPDGHCAITSFLGGARSPELTTNTDDKKIELVLGELRSLLGVEGTPAFSKVINWSKAIPQYNVGYSKVLTAIDRFEANYHGAFICSNFRGGISVSDCIISSEKMAGIVRQYVTEI